MHSFNETTTRHGEDFKVLCLKTVTELGITQQEIADATGYNHATISRWITSGDFHFPAFLVPLLASERLRPLAKAMLEFQSSKLGYLLTRAASPAAKLNHSIEDEATEIIIALGKAIEVARKSPEKSAKITQMLDMVIDAAERAKMEIGAM